MIQLYADAMAARNYRQQTIQKNRQIVAQYLKSTDLKRITTESVEAHLASMQHAGKSASTIQNHRSAIKSFCAYLHATGMIRANPVLSLQQCKIDEEIPICLTDDEIADLLITAEENEIECEVTLALNTGLRMEELRLLGWADVDFSLRQIIVRKTKGRRPRTIPANHKSLEALKKQQELYGQLVYVFPGGQGGPGGKSVWTKAKPRGRKWWSETAPQILQTCPSIAALKKGRTGRGWHALRHTFATRAAQAGIDLFKLQKWMGHRRIETTMRYVHLTEQYDSDIERI